MNLEGRGNESGRDMKAYIRTSISGTLYSGMYLRKKSLVMRR